MPKKGLTLLEIIVSTIILTLVITGIVNLFISAKRYTLHSRSRMTSGMLGGYFLDPLQSKYVRQDKWEDDTNCLSTGNCTDESAGILQGLDRNYTANYTVTPNYNNTNLSKVTVSIIWNESLP
jgi:Tfp pilus assembly protein PilV